MRWLYFKPAIAQIQQEEDSITHLKNTISLRSLGIMQKKQQQKEHWLACQQYCQEQMPPISKPDIVAGITDGSPVTQLVCDDATLKQLSDAVTQVLVQRIDHVS